MELRRALPANTVIKFKVTEDVFPLSISSTFLVLSSREINGFSRKEEKALDVVAEFLMARSSDSTWSSVLDLEAAM
jgi:hypothetical protein